MKLQRCKNEDISPPAWRGYKTYALIRTQKISGTCFLGEVQPKPDCQAETSTDLNRTEGSTAFVLISQEGEKAIKKE